MPNFPNPFEGNIERKMSKYELVQALRIDVAGELEAMFLYDAHAHATDDPVVKKVLSDIRDEEREHVGELLALIHYLDPAVTGFLAEGNEEVQTMMKELGLKPDASGSDVSAATPGPSVGSLLDSF